MSFQDLEPELALALMGVISQSTDEEFKKTITSSLKTSAGARKGLYAMMMSWNGTDIPVDIQQRIAEEFGVEFLYKRNVLSIDGTMIELFVLGSALPDEFLTNFFHFDIKERAANEGLTVEEVEEFIKSTYRGTDGNGDYLFEFDSNTTRYKYLYVLGVGGFGRSDCGRYQKVYANMSTFGIENIRNILFRKETS